MRDASTLVIGIYEKCPALDIETFEKLGKHALENLLEPVLAYASRNPRAVRNYDSAYKIIWRQ
ncbi:MAG: hypothetical protein Q4F40_04780 [Akkermansia sp.]|nr:hypothetical protein [Akkermansia sp.]